MTTLRNVLFLSGIASVVCSNAAVNRCCPGGYLVPGGKCRDGTDILLTNQCDERFLLDPDNYPETDEFVINNDGSLSAVNMPTSYEAHTFCVGKFNESYKDVAVICTAGGNWYQLRAACGFMSVIFLVLTIIVYIMVPRLRDLQGICILHSLVGLALAFFSLAMIQLFQIPDNDLCIFAAFVLYITFMVAFSWLNVVAFNVWRTTVIPNLYKKTDGKWHVIYCIYAYGLPACLAIAALTAHSLEGDHIKPGFGEGVCFFDGTVPTWAYFYGPISVLLVINLILFVSTSMKLWSADIQLSSPKLRTLKCRFLLTIKLFLIMGLLWIFEVISFAGQNIHKYLDYLWVITDYLNIMQGVLIFLVLVVFRKKALRGLAKNSFIGGKLPGSWRTLEDEECTEPEEENKDINSTI